MKAAAADTRPPPFGDGAGAVLMSPAREEGQGILQSKLRTDGSLTGIVGQYVGGTIEGYTPEAVRDGGADHLATHAKVSCFFKF